MRSSFLTLAVSLACFFPASLATPSSADSPAGLSALCEDPSVVSESYIGDNKDVKMTAYSCSNVIAGAGNDTSDAHKREDDLEEGETSLTKRALGVCGATCDTHCFNPAGGGPDPNQCKVISNALRYYSQTSGNVFNIPRNAAVVHVQYASCYSFFVNQANQDLQYCRQDWAAVLDYVAFNCQAPQNAHGGLCVARSQQWFIQVQHS
ncbi:hypothetical protein BXZ70DRAFT_1011192 [Cristinia sonorae]|uniref:Uncharacterized protein n=1 Tax=Cristinia sonorae TaxID=1940300 RepID=A0A8K0UI89_9AGAR|nr:hypothetical protein BXZ70DRAFT_1011192 [Cristinia sonorae]